MAPYSEEWRTIAELASKELDPEKLMPFLTSSAARSIPLREWVQKHKDSKYIPQDLLEAWGIAAVL